jgi:hypothetical protein
MKRLFITILVLIFPMTASAQSPLLPTPPQPPPLQSPAPSPTFTKSVGDLIGTVFTEEEKRTLPPGLQKRGLSKELEAKLPPAQVGTERKVISNDVVLLDKTTNVVLDIIRDVIKGSGK